MGTGASRLLLLAAIASLSIAAAPAGPGAVGELDALSRSTAGAAPGIALARQQIAGGDLLGALASLERVLTAHPESDMAVLLHASLLCRLDDRAGATIEFDDVRGRQIPEQLWNEATAACAANGGNGRPGGRP